MGCGWCAGHCPTEGIDMVLATTNEVVWNGYGSIKNWCGMPERAWADPLPPRPGAFMKVFVRSFASVITSGKITDRVLELPAGETAVDAMKV